MKSLVTITLLTVLMSFAFATAIYVPAEVATIQGGIDSASAGDTVLVASGIYTENIDFKGKDVVVLSIDGPDSTIIDGASKGTVALFVNGETNAAVLEGFTVRHGIGHPTSPTQNFGGGICMRYGSSPTLKNLIVTNNTSSVGTNSSGGGIGISTGSTPIIEDVTVMNNQAKYGGGIYSYYSAPTLKNVTVTGNVAWGSGGGVAFENKMDSQDPIIDGLVVYENRASTGGGGGLWFYNGSFAVLNRVTVYDNTAALAYGGGGIFILAGSEVYVLNSIVRNNLPSEIYSLVTSVYKANEIGIAYSDIKGGENGLKLSSGELALYDSNIDEAPEFENPSNGDFTLVPSSPCIDAGVAQYVVGPLLLLDLSPDEYCGQAPDMGGCEMLRNTTDLAPVISIPTTMTLNQNYPNPFNPSTSISYSLDEMSDVRLEIFNIQGQLVSTLFQGIQTTGTHILSWDGYHRNGNAVESGIYLYRLTANGVSTTRSMLLIR